LGTATTAGFGLRGLSWYEYFFTQWRMFWKYLMLVVLPMGLNVDPDVTISRTAFDQGAIIGGVAIAALIVAAIVYRRRFPLASFGILTFLVLLAPTSSIVPIRDVFAERRLYLPMIGLLCVAVEGLRRINLRETASVAAIGAVLAIASYVTWHRAHVWASGLALWENSVENSPQKYRPRFQYAFALYQEQRCTEAAEQYEKASALDRRPGERLIVDLALALDCAGRSAEAAQKLQAATATHPTGVIYMNLGMIYGKTGRNEEALLALAEAEKRNPRFAQIYAFKGNVYLSQDKVGEAAEQYRKALQLDPANQAAMHGLRAISGQ
ncbi:MAG: tetratricopeptide repeat protein, partial [Acidobacteriota bacterium]